MGVTISSWWERAYGCLELFLSHWLSYKFKSILTGWIWLIFLPVFSGCPGEPAILSHSRSYGEERLKLPGKVTSLPTSLAFVPRSLLCIIIIFSGLFNLVKKSCNHHPFCLVLRVQLLMEPQPALHFWGLSCLGELRAYILTILEKCQYLPPRLWWGLSKPIPSP